MFPEPPIEVLTVLASTLAIIFPEPPKPKEITSALIRFFAIIFPDPPKATASIFSKGIVTVSFFVALILVFSLKCTFNFPFLTSVSIYFKIFSSPSKVTLPSVPLIK